MKYVSAFIYLNIAYAGELICFLMLFYFNIEIFFITYLIIITSLILFVINLTYWYYSRKSIFNIKNIDKKRVFIIRLIFCIVTYITPVYCIIQEPSLVVSRNVSIITYTIVTIFAIMGILIERKILIFQTQKILVNK